MPPVRDVEAQGYKTDRLKTATHTRRFLGRREFALVTTLVLSAAAALCLLQGTEIREHIDAHATKHRILRELQTLSSLRLHFVLKRSSMYVHGESEFDVFVNPIVASNGSVSFEGISSFTEGENLYKYLLVDGTAYAVTQSTTDASNISAICLPSSDVPLIDDVLVAINDAAAVTSSTTVSDSTITTECADGTLYQLSFSDDDFLLCSTLDGSSSTGFKIYGSDLNIEVYYTSSVTTVMAPALSDSSTCEKVSTGTSVEASSTTTALLSGARRMLTEQAAEVSMASSSCTCKGVKRPCVFYHGFGSTNELGLVDTSPTTYFGDIIQEHAPCCSSIQYAVFNTRDHGWTEDALQEKTCNAALAVSSSSDNSTRTIKDTIIVAHSMGNLMLAGAIASGKCSLDSSSSWIAASGPFKGSMGSNFLQDACTGSLTGVVSSVLDLLGNCPADAALAALPYEGTTYSTTTENAQYAAAQAVYSKHVTAALCSDGYSGLLSWYQPVFLLAGSVIPHKSSENDGLVEFQSCAAGLDSSSFGSSYESANYVSGLNHIDTTFRYGDGLFSNNKKPVKWFECLL